MKKQKQNNNNNKTKQKQKQNKTTTTKPKAIEIRPQLIYLAPACSDVFNYRMPGGIK